MAEIVELDEVLTPHPPPRNLDRSLSSSTSSITGGYDVIRGIKDRRPTSSSSTSKPADDIRIITDNFQDLLKTATKEITKLTSEKRKLQRDYAKLLSVNEEIADGLSKVLNREKELESEKRAVIKANDELYREAQRLTDEEARWHKERGELEKRISDLTRQLKDGYKDNDTVKDLQDENSKLLELYKRGNEERDDLLREISRFKAENESLLSRKEMTSGENLQLMLEVDNQTKLLDIAREQAESANERCRRLERENQELSSKLKAQKASHTDALLADRAAERAAELASKNRDLMEWRNQLNDKNQALMNENAKLKSKCANLEDLLNEESADINEVLELIKNLQLQASNHSCAIPPSAIGPISKFRDFKLHNPR